MLNIKKIKPMYNYIVTTKDVYSDKDSEGKFTLKLAGTLKEYQKVVAVGPMVRGIQPGDLVCINPKRYAKYKHQPGSLKDGVIEDNPVVAYNFNVVELDHVPHLLLTEQDIDFVIEEYEEETETESNIVIPEKILIL